MDHGPKVVVVAQSARDASHPPNVPYEVVQARRFET
jgi:hypothetical protein